MSILTKLILISCFLCILLNLVESKKLRNIDAYIDQRIKDAVSDLANYRISGLKIQPAAQDGIELVETYPVEEDIFEILLAQDQDKSSIYMINVSYEIETTQKMTIDRVILCYISPADKGVKSIIWEKAFSIFKSHFYSTTQQFNDFSGFEKETIMGQMPQPWFF
ncbi:hypothetical protein TTHERM_00361780 (macronuclear) [Tetrahymena thermophila SB210]|uniref:Transmembrane protein n=1 Tax=Tetrahymena thermophila (strain SB210) TaxID=312017 RepID=Q22PG6_TETTS|nr:hypothetical protein TTHERM_00361780 [Tetrahymena thermophila SB210]EAR87143.1 hypothetical protein TTHERM_00361780 [Tetrahymena thermophila SB210]|eukprot:XP_001007388.1 hypothetical protein TTHERM_00361780 [Tetrahymena thermophila SB210]